MKPTILILSIALFCSCEKEQIAHTEFGPCQPAAGMWSGRMDYTVPGLVSQTINCNREILHLSDTAYTMRWWSDPDTAVIVAVSDSIRYCMGSDELSTSCGHQRVIWQYFSTGYILNDTLRESGTVIYRFYFDDSLLVESAGRFTSWSVWRRKVY